MVVSEWSVRAPGLSKPSAISGMILNYTAACASQSKSTIDSLADLAANTHSCVCVCEYLCRSFQPPEERPSPSFVFHGELYLHRGNSQLNADHRTVSQTYSLPVKCSIRSSHTSGNDVKFKAKRPSLVHGAVEKGASRRAI